jgi:hypothetical protein
MFHLFAPMLKPAESIKKIQAQALSKYIWQHAHTHQPQERSGLAEKVY